MNIFLLVVKDSTRKQTQKQMMAAFVGAVAELRKATN